MCGITRARHGCGGDAPGLSMCVRDYHRTLRDVKDRHGTIPLCAGLPGDSPEGAGPGGGYPRVSGITRR